MRSPAEGAVNVGAQTPQNQEAENLRRKIEELQREINKMKKGTRD
jgi:cell division protein FtsB